MRSSLMRQFAALGTSLKTLFQAPSQAPQRPNSTPALPRVPQRPGHPTSGPASRPGYYAGTLYSEAADLPEDLQAAFGEGGLLQFQLYGFYVAFVIDTSPNIQMRDVYPSRWDAARTVIMKYLARMAGKNLAVRAAIVCTSTADRLSCPLTHVRDSHVFAAAMRTMPPTGAGLWLNYSRCLHHIQHATVRVVVLSDGHDPRNRQFLLDGLLRYPLPHHFDCIGLAGSPAQVDEEVLKTMASPGRDGRPRYRWVDQADELIHTFGDLDLEDER